MAAARRVSVKAGERLIESLRRAGLEVQALCGGVGRCGRCKVKVVDGREVLRDPSGRELETLGAEAVEAGYRLSCLAVAEYDGEVEVYVPPHRVAGYRRLLMAGVEPEFPHIPAVLRKVVRIPKSTVGKPEPRDFMLLDALRKSGVEAFRVSYHALKELSEVEDESTVTVTVYLGEVVSVRKGGSTGCYGLAYDVGTTKLACYLVDLHGGRLLASASSHNPQSKFGEDVLSRVRYTMEGYERVLELQRLVVGEMNRLADEVCRKADVDVGDVCEVVAVGNTVMHHILLGLSPKGLGVSPYAPTTREAVTVRAAELGLKTGPETRVYMPPVVAGFIGSDAVADVVSSGMHKGDEIRLLIDVGTNTEIILGNREHLIACSCASGPALEGGHISCGMRAVEGAIEAVWIDKDTLDVGYKVIGDAKPVGVCGSGVVDAVASMFRAGVVDETGRIRRDVETDRLVFVDGKPGFVLAYPEETADGRPIVFTQRDVEEAILAKAAIRAGVEVLLKVSGVDVSEVHEVMLAGAFGTYMDPESAMLIGMYPRVPLDRVRFLGNSAGSGARAMLRSLEAREEAERVAGLIEYVELAARPEFREEFFRALYIPYRE